MGFIGLFFVGAALAAGVISVFAAAAAGTARKIKNGEPLLGTEEERRKIPKHIVIAFAVVGAIGIIPYGAVFLAAAAVWVLWRVIRGKTLDRETVMKTAVTFLAAVGVIFSVLMAYGGLSALIKG